MHRSSLHDASCRIRNKRTAMEIMENLTREFYSCENCEQDNVQRCCCCRCDAHGCGDAPCNSTHAMMRASSKKNKRQRIQTSPFTMRTSTSGKFTGASWNASNMLLLAFVILYLGNLMVLVRASIPCTNNAICQQIQHLDSECLPSGYCSNPFRGGCLNAMLPGWSKPRICTSEDTADDVANGYCRLPIEYGHHHGRQSVNNFIDHLEIRINSQNWDSALFEGWILQILLTEMLDVPVTIESGKPNVRLDFYDPLSTYDYGTSNDWQALKRGYEVKDCRKLRDHNLQNPDDYQSCAHLIPEVWAGHQDIISALHGQSTVEVPVGLGALGQQGWFMPKFTAERDPTLLNFLGLMGEQNRRKLAETFLRPTKWSTYCEEVSPTKCTVPDSVAQRAPKSPDEETRMFVEGLYTGYFRNTTKNDCDANPTNCTGHIADYPCTWLGYVVPQTYWLNIALSSDGDEAISFGYTYSQLTEIWAAANATKSNVVMLWWQPEALIQTYLGTDAEFLRVTLPTTTQECEDSRITVEDRCHYKTLAQKYGNATGSCEEPPRVLQKLVGGSLYDSTYDPSIPEAKISPGYDVIKSFTISDLQIGQIFQYWLKRTSGESQLENPDPRYATCHWFVNNIEFVKNFVPRTYPREFRDDYGVNAGPLFICSVILGCIATLMTLTVMIATYRQRKRRVIVHAQVEFLLILLSGLFIVSIASVLITLPPTNGVCVSLAWFINMGYTLELVPLVIKVDAINRLMQAAQHMRRVVLKRKVLFFEMSSICIIVFVYLLVWTIVQPPYRDTSFQLTLDTTPEGATIVTLNHFCHMDGVWMYIGVGWQALLLIWATVLAFQTRHVREDVNESRTLAMMIYSHFVFVVLRVVTYLLGASVKASDRMRAQSLIFSVDAIITILIYFIPKFLTKDDAFSAPMPRRGGFMVASRTTRANNSTLNGESELTGFSFHLSTQRFSADVSEDYGGSRQVRREDDAAIEKGSDDADHTSPENRQRSPLEDHGSASEKQTEKGDTHGEGRAGDLEKSDAEKSTETEDTYKSSVTAGIDKSVVLEHIIEKFSGKNGEGGTSPAAPHFNSSPGNGDNCMRAGDKEQNPVVPEIDEAP